MITNITTVQQFNDMLDKDISILKISTSTCVPCKKLMNPIFDEIQRETQSDYLYSVVLDEADPSLAQHIKTTYSVSTVPTFIRFEKNEVTDKAVGAIPKSKLKEKLRLA